MIYNALLPLIRLRDSEIIAKVLPTLVLITSKMEFCLDNKNLTDVSPAILKLSIKKKT